MIVETHQTVVPEQIRATISSKYEILNYKYFPGTEKFNII
jgi:hypothetical protein